MAIGTAAAIIGGTVASGLIGASSAKSAAKSQAKATGQAADAQLQAQREALELQRPAYEAGDSARNRLLELLGIGGSANAAGYGSLNKQFSFNPTDLQNEPGYQFQLQQGQNALDRRAAAGGSFFSGAGLQAASNFNQDLAGTSYNNAYNRALNTFQTNRTNTLNPLQALAGQGQSAANNMGQIQTGTGNALANLYSGLGNAQGASRIAQGNALSGAIGNGLSAWQQAQYLGQMNPLASGAGIGLNSPITLAGSNAGFGFGFP
jgi:hypothetical protein